MRKIMLLVTGVLIGILILNSFVLASPINNKEIFHNSPPGKPYIDGPVTCTPRTYIYTFQASDPDGDIIKYHIDWGDGNEEWTCWHGPGVEITVSHTYTHYAEIIICAYAKDIHGAEGPAGTIPIKFSQNFHQYKFNEFSGFKPTIIPRFFSFNSYIDLDFDTTMLDEPLELDVSVIVPTTVRFWTDFPPLIWNIIPWPFNSIFLFRSIIAPMQKINLEVLNAPDWLRLYFSSNPVITHIPFADDYNEIATNMIISLSSEAPAISYKLDLNAYCEDVGRIRGSMYRASIVFTPSYCPCLNIVAQQFTECPRNQSTIIPVNMTNCGNKLSKVEVSISEIPEGFSIDFVPKEFHIDIDEIKQGFLIVEPPENFIGYELIKLSFHIEQYPYHEGSPTATNEYIIVVQVI